MEPNFVSLRGHIINVDAIDYIEVIPGATTTVTVESVDKVIETDRKMVVHFRGSVGPLTIDDLGEQDDLLNKTGIVAKPD